MADVDCERHPSRGRNHNYPWFQGGGIYMLNELSARIITWATMAREESGQGLVEYALILVARLDRRDRHPDDPGRRHQRRLHHRLGRGHRRLSRSVLPPPARSPGGRRRTPLRARPSNDFTEAHPRRIRHRAGRIRVRPAAAAGAGPGHRRLRPGLQLLDRLDAPRERHGALRRRQQEPRRSRLAHAPAVHGAPGVHERAARRQRPGDACRRLRVLSRRHEQRR